MLTRIRDSEGSHHVVNEWVKSSVLEGNPAGETAVRPFSVYLPPAAVDPKRRFPVLYCLAPWLSAGRQLLQWEPFKESLAERLTRLIQNGKIQDCIVVCPDLYTSFGGSQYINSTFLGRHAEHIVLELIPYIEAHYPVIPGAASRAVFGRSSGGYGALRLAMDFPGTFAAVACHSGDMGFELLYKRDLVEFCYALSRTAGKVAPYLAALRQQPKLSGKDTHILMLMGMAASYSPDLEHADGFRLPIDPLSGEIDEKIWLQWLSHDPLFYVERHAEGLRQLSCLYLECGNRDQYHLHFGMRQFSKKLQQLQIPHQALEFDDNHSGTAYRYDVSLPFLSQALVHDT